MDKENKIVKVFGRILALILVVLGVFYSFQRNMASKIFMISTREKGHESMDKADFSQGDGNEEWNHGKGNNKKGEQALGQVGITEEPEEGESLEDFLGRLVH